MREDIPNRKPMERFAVIVVGVVTNASEF